MKLILEFIIEMDLNFWSFVFQIYFFSILFMFHWQKIFNQILCVLYELFSSKFEPIPWKQKYGQKKHRHFNDFLSWFSWESIRFSIDTTPINLILQKHVQGIFFIQFAALLGFWHSSQNWEKKKWKQKQNFCSSKNIKSEKKRTEEISQMDPMWWKYNWLKMKPFKTDWIKINDFSFHKLGINFLNKSSPTQVRCFFYRISLILFNKFSMF